MHQAIKSGSIPQECFAKKNSHCNHATLTKRFFCDSSCCLHHAASIGECDLTDCYNRAAYMPTSVALQSWGIPTSAICVLLLLMRTMQYVLKTGLGKSSESFGGTTVSPNSGLGQGSGASPPAFLELSVLIVNAYQQMVMAHRFALLMYPRYSSFLQSCMLMIRTYSTGLHQIAVDPRSN